MLTEAEATRLASAWLASPESVKEYDGKRDAVAAAADWLEKHGPDLEAALAPLMTGLLTDGQFIGAVSARAVTAGAPVAKAKHAKGKGGKHAKPRNAPAPVQAEGWKPGDTAKASGILQKLGLKGPEPKHAKDTSGKLAGGVRTALGRVLVEGKQAAASAADMARNAATAAADKAKAAAAALDQITQAAAQAAYNWYSGVGVEYVEWVTDSANPCPICQANEDEGPVKFGEPFASGDEEAPIHPHCRCAVLPAAGWDVPQAPAQPAPFTPLQFTTAAEAQQWLTDHTPDLSPEQAEAVDWYTGPGAYEANAPIRNGEALPADVAVQVANLDAALAPLPADLVLSRMVDLDAFPGVTDLSSLAGQVIADPAFMSTSLGPPVKDAGTDVLMHIAAPKGTPAVITGTASRLPKQREIVLARGTRLAVSQAKRNDLGTWEMWLVVVPGE